MAIYSDLRQLKSELGIDRCDTSEDLNLGFFLETASSWIEEWFNRPGIFYKERTEYYNGTGTQNLLLRSRPVYTTPTIQVLVDGAGYYGSASGAFTNQNSQLTYGTDFCIQIDQEDGTSRSGILVRINNYWPRPFVRTAGLLSSFLGQQYGGVKVIYTAGYTVNNLPAVFREACNLLVARLRYIWPLGVELNSESYEDRSIGIVTSEKSKLMALVVPMLMSFRNWKFGGG